MDLDDAATLAAIARTMNEITAASRKLRITPVEYADAVSSFFRAKARTDLVISAIAKAAA